MKKKNKKNKKEKKKERKIVIVLRVFWSIVIFVLIGLTIYNLLTFNKLFQPQTIEVNMPYQSNDYGGMLVSKGLCSYICTTHFKENIESMGVNLGLTEDNKLLIECLCGEDYGKVSIEIDVSEWEDAENVVGTVGGSCNDEMFL